MVFLSRFIPILVCVGLLAGVVQAQSVGTIHRYCGRCYKRR